MNWFLNLQKEKREKRRIVMSSENTADKFFAI
jgi:hypothetical protein